MSEQDYAADCVACTWASSTTGTDFGKEKIQSLAGSHFRQCEQSDCVLLKVHQWDDEVGEKVESVVGQVNVDGLELDDAEGVSA